MRLLLTPFVLIGFLAAATPFLTGCSDYGYLESVTVAGSTTILPIAEVAAEKFVQSTPDASVLVSGMGSSAGIEAVSTGTADIGTSSRHLRPNESHDLVDIPIAYDGIAVIVNLSNPIDELTTEQLRDIYGGAITNWREVGGDDIPIDLINRDEASGTRDAFTEAVMDDTPFDVGAVILPGTGQVREVVTRSAGAIGYISVGFVSPRFGTNPVKALVIDGVDPTRENVGNGVYPISRTLHFFTLGEPDGLTKRYIEYVLSDAVQFGAVVDAGYIPVTWRGEE
ncbi:MAG: phosphate ABC transporter substrate-binding protein [Coriobacteriia bacterium]|nr:phosphate ABC transporter substrate-binding protein [Coriobacteriia bacterium]